MTEEFDLNRIALPDSMHDLDITGAKLKDGSLILKFSGIHFCEEDLIEGSEYYAAHKDHTSCRLEIALLAEPKYISCELTTPVRHDRFKGKTISLKKLIKQLDSGEIEAEMISAGVFYQVMSIELHIFKKKSKYCCCRIDIPASKAVYKWK